MIQIWNIYNQNSNIKYIQLLKWPFLPTSWVENPQGQYEAPGSWSHTFRRISKLSLKPSVFILRGWAELSKNVQLTLPVRLGCRSSGATDAQTASGVQLLIFFLSYFFFLQYNRTRTAGRDRRVHSLKQSGSEMLKVKATSAHARVHMKRPSIAINKTALPINRPLGAEATASHRNARRRK